MEIPKRITFIDVRDKKYVLPVKLITEAKLEMFLQNAPPREKDSTSDDAIFKFPDPPDAVEVMVQVLQHGEFNNFPHWEDRSTILRNLLDAVRVGDKYFVDGMAVRAIDMFDDHVRHYKDLLPNMDDEYADFVDTVLDLYRPILPEGWDTMTPDELFFSRRAPREDSYIPLLKRYVVQFAADNYYDLAYEDECLKLFGGGIITYPDGLHPFHKDVKKVMKRQREINFQTESWFRKTGQRMTMEDWDWSEFFADERYVTFVDCKKKRYRLTRKDVLEQSKFLYECAPKSWSEEVCSDNYHFVHEIYELPDHPHGIRAIAAMINEGPRYFDVPDDVQEEGLAVQYLAHALAAADEYGVFGMREAVTGLLGYCDYLSCCRKPSTIVHAIKTVYALEQYGKNDRVLRELKDRFVEWAVARGVEGRSENAVRCACRKVPAFGADVRKADVEEEEEKKKKRSAAEGGGTEDKDVDGGAGEAGGSEEDSDSRAEEDLDSSAEDSDGNAGEGVDDKQT